MRTLFVGILLGGMLAGPSAKAQSVPYSLLATIEQSAKECQGNKFVTVFLKIEHANPGDKRPFTLTLKAPGVTKPVEVKENGEVVLPSLPRGVWKDAAVTHNLEKGALSLNYGFRFEGKLVNFSNGKKSIHECLEEIKSGPKEELAKIAKMGSVLPPEARHSTFAVAGIYLKSDGGEKGKVNLMHQGAVVQIFDLSQPGKAVWSFEKYDPKTHHIVFEGTDKDSKAVVDFVPVLAPKEKLPPNSVEILTFTAVE